MSGTRGDLCDELAAEFGALFCHEPLVAFYAGGGWQRVDVPVTIDQPSDRLLRRCLYGPPLRQSRLARRPHRPQRAALLKALRD